MIIKLLKKTIDTEKCPLLFEEPFAKASALDEWHVLGGEWWIQDGWLTGKHPDNSPGIIMNKRGFQGNVLVSFEGRNVAPSTHDINLMWNMSWDEDRNCRGVAYVAGVQGWWEGKVGIEKSPEYVLNVATPLFAYNPGQTYFIQAGSIDGHCFICIDGRLSLEVTDPNPIDSLLHQKIGFEAYSSFIQIRNVKIRRLVWEHTNSTYAPEFS